MSHYFYRPYNNLPNFYGYAYNVQQFAAWNNYTVPFALNPMGYFYEPHYYYPRNDSEQVPVVVCKSNPDKTRFCPFNANMKYDGVKSVNNVVCTFDNRTNVTAAESLAECQFPGRWPAQSLTSS